MAWVATHPTLCPIATQPFWSCSVLVLLYNLTVSTMGDCLINNIIIISQHHMITNITLDSKFLLLENYNILYEHELRFYTNTFS